MAQTTFQGPVRSLGGFYSQGPNCLVSLSASATLTPQEHGGKIITVGGSLAATTTLTLPTINTDADPASSGPGADPNNPNNLGVVYTFWIPTTISTSTLKIATDGTDKFVGSLLSVDTDSSGAMVGFTAASSNDNINLNGTTTGGVAGTWVQVVAVAANKYMVTGVVNGSGTVATPFADS